MITPAWYAWAQREVGTKEVPGTQDNPRIEEYWKIGQVPLNVSDDETPWCAAFACAAIEQAGYRSPRTPRARGFKDGAFVQRCDHRIGAIVVLESDRGPASGHVGFLAGVSPGRLHLLGGNQGNRVCIAPFPATRVVALLWPLAAVAHIRYPMAPMLASDGRVVSDG